MLGLICSRMLCLYVHFQVARIQENIPRNQIFTQLAGVLHVFSPSGQGGNGPGRPLGHVDRSGADLDAPRRRARLEQVVVDVRVEVRRLRARERAVRVAADEREAHGVGHAVGLVDEAAGAHGGRGRDGPQPVDVVLDDEEAARHGQRRQQVVVLGDAGRLGDVGVEARREPGVLADDLARRLDVGAGVVLRVADAPGLSGFLFVSA